MADKDVNIKISTKADARALDSVNKKLEKFGKVRAEASKDVTKALSSEEKATKKLADEKKKLQREVKKAEVEAYKHEAALKKEANALKKVEDRTKVLADRELKKLQREKNKAEVAAHKHAAALERESKSTNKLSKETSEYSKKQTKAGNSILYASQAFEDLQYGIRGVLNNIPQLVMSLGGTAGLAGVISIVAVVASKLGGAFNTAKTAAKDLGSALSGINSRKLEDLNDAMSDASATEAFTKAINAQTEAIESNTTAVSANIAKAREARKLRLEVAKAEAELELAQIETGGGSASSKVKRSNKVKARIAALSGQDKAATAKESITALQAGRAGALSDAEKARVRANQLNQSAPSAASITSKERSAQRAEAARLRSISIVTGSQDSDLSSLRFGDDAGGRTKGGDPSVTDNRIITSNKEMAKAVAALEEALSSEIPIAIETALEGVVSVANRNKSRFESDVSAFPELKMQTEDKNINAIALAARNALTSESEIGRFNQERLELEKKRESSLSESLEEAANYTRLSQEAVAMESQIASAKAKLAALEKVQAAKRKTRALVAEDEIKTAKAGEDAARAKAQAKAIKDAQRDLAGKRGEIAGEAGSIDLQGQPNASAAVQRVSNIYQDKVITQSEEKQITELMKMFRESSTTKNNELIKGFMVMIEEERKMAKKIKQLTNNAKRNPN